MKILTDKEILNIPEKDLPLLVLSFNSRNILSTLINIRKRSNYNHFMLYHRPGFFAAQGLIFKEFPVTNYLTHHRLKFWHNPDWSALDKVKMQSKIKRWLMLGKFKSRYDLVGLIGQLFGVKSLQNPYTKICSDYIDLLKEVDSEYKLKYPAPNDVNAWLKDHSRYQVYGRYIRD